ncbi:molybdopterin-dependent oxidoreductase [Adlercreutzia sp. R25]|uniref:molybdopterin-containing oxidoreductase family protein n=1 Tax=Adlercreutzia shanghongiae TaxID=3111773 RepID=UPI002DB80655|nr:molybdopterin-dependent oxidoreductase [Adlercreutzia sp. R25]MEC4271916.1 molybdopterin-dependent oxidoreductase [Adlercreutzia sp. R25]
MALLNQASTRRSFLKASAAAAAATAAAGLAGCAPKAQTETAETGGSAAGAAHVVESDAAILEGKGEWLPMRCSCNCNGTCVNMGYVVDGVVVRQKTDDNGDGSDELGFFQQRGCPKGRSARQELYGVDRLKYPMKRKNWQPGGGDAAHGELRGRDEWERISWDEALDLVAGELERVYRDYGPTAVVANAWRYSRDGANFLYSLGGCVTLADTESFGTYAFRPELLGMNVVWGDHVDIQRANDRYDMKNADYIVLYGSNPAWSQMSGAPWLFKLAEEEGVKFVTVSPERSMTNVMYGAEWLPMRPGTDTAFLLAVMYEMLRLDEEEGDIVDWDFLKKYTVGFTLDNMPADAKLNECISEYVKGAYDNIPKTPEWASEICGTPVEQITEFARMCGKKNNVMLLHSYAPSRCNGAENFPQAFLTVGAMGGHMGKSGNACAVAYSFDIADSGDWLFQSPDVRSRGYLANPIENANIEGASFYDAILKGSYLSTCPINHNGLTDIGVTFHEKKEMPVNAKIMFAYNNNFVQSRMDANSAIKAMRSVDMCVAMDMKTSITVQFSDIILPISTPLEGNDDPDFGPLCWPPLRTAYRKDTMVSAWPLVKPAFESRTDEWVFRELLTRLGKNPDEAFNESNKTFYFDHFANSEYVSEDGQTWNKILKWTEEDNAKYGVDNETHDGEMTFDEFIHAGKFQVKRSEGDGYTYIGYKDFIDDPEGHPLPSKSGKWELYCQLKADNYNVQGINPEPIKPYANYIVPVNGYEESFTDWAGKVKGNYPLQAYTAHYIRRAHTRFDNLPWLQEAFTNPVFMNAEDAAERGIADGDTVLVKSPYGKTLRQAALWNSMMPGVICVPHGPHSVFDETDPDDIIDRGGAEQILYGPVHSNYFQQLDGYNTLLVEVEKYDGEPLVPDCEREPFLSGAGEAE